MASASANNSNSNNNHHDTTLPKIELTRLKHQLRLLMGLPEKSTKKRVSTKRRIMFRNEIGKGSIANVRETLSREEACKESSKVENDIIKQIASLYKNIEDYQKHINCNGSTSKKISKRYSNFNRSVESHIRYSSMMSK